MVKVFKTLPRNFRGFAPCETPHGEHKKLFFENDFRTKQTAPSKTGESGSEAGKGRSTTVWKIFDGRAESEEIDRRSRFKPGRWRQNGNITSDRINLALREHRDGAMVVGLVGVLVNQFVQRRTRGHRVEQQKHSHQPGGQGRLAKPKEISRFVLQIVCNIADSVPLARSF
jgi:hypothetical protein